MRRWPLLPVLLLLAACESRPPVNRGQVVAIADNVQRMQSVNWGDPQEVLPPVPGPDGRSWWQVRYRDGHLVLVDADSGWGRLPPADYEPRVRMRPTTTPAGGGAVTEEGSLVLRLSEPAVLDGEAAGRLEREAVRLNDLATHNGLQPLFSVRSDRQQRSMLLYGWQGDRGIARDDQVSAWIRSRTTYQPTWIDLLPVE